MKGIVKKLINRIRDRYRSLPTKTKNLLNLGVVLALIVALPLFIYSLTELNLEIRKRAASGEPLPTAIKINNTFDNSESINFSQWGWNGPSGSDVVVQGGQLKATMLAGIQDQTREVLSMFPKLSCQNIYAEGDFDVKVDMAGAGTAYQELSFGGVDGVRGVAIRRTNDGSQESLQALVTNGTTLSETYAVYNLPANTQAIRVRLLKIGSNIQFQYSLNTIIENYTTLASIDTTNVTPTLPSKAQFYLIVGGNNSNYPPITAYFDRFFATLNATYTGIPCLESPSPSPTATATPTASASATPTASPTATPITTIEEQIMRFQVRFGGVSDAQAEGAKIKVRFVKGAYDMTTPPFSVSHIGGGVYEGSIDLSASPVPAGSGYAFFVKGEKHLATKFCEQSGTQTTRCTGLGNINVFNGIALYGFQNLALEPGDLPDQDGAANANDFVKIKNLLTKSCGELTADEKLTADLDYSDCINTRDAFLMRQTLESRYDEN